jgi:hypothetical protein
MRPRAPAVSDPPRPHADTAGAAVRALVHADETEIPPGEQRVSILVLLAEEARADGTPSMLKGARGIGTGYIALQC